MDVSQAAHHVQDAAYFEIPRVLWQYLPAALKGDHPHPGQVPLPQFGPYDLAGYHFQFQVTKFMVVELAVAVLMVLIFVPLARRMATGERVRGRLGNAMEAVLLFIRDEMARPAIGHGSERFLPYLWTSFFFVLFCNLFGLLPWAGSPTGSIAVTAVLALFTFATVVGAGVASFGPVRFWLGLVPHMDLHPVMAIILKPMILLLEVAGLLIRHIVLAIRLLANMFAGHLVLAVILGFIVMTANSWIWYGVMPVSVFGAVAINLLELLVAFLQAYIFTFLSALFIGMAVHQH